MTAQELISYFNRIFGIEKEWPISFEVDAVTYANCCQYLIDEYIGRVNDSSILSLVDKNRLTQLVSLYVGKNGGILFRNVELTLIGYKK